MSVSVSLFSSVINEVILPHVLSIVEGRETTREQKVLVTMTLQRMALMEYDANVKVEKVKALVNHPSERVKQTFASMFSSARNAVKTLSKSNPVVLDHWRSGLDYKVLKELKNGDEIEVPVSCWNFKTIFMSDTEKRNVKLEALAKQFAKLSPDEKQYVLNYDPRNANSAELADWAKMWVKGLDIAGSDEVEVEDDVAA